MSGFEQVLGNQNNLEHFAQAAARDRLSHAYILSGPAGSGKKTLAAHVAAALLCRERDLVKGPCGKCPSCIRAASGNHPDIICLRHEKDRVITVDEVRDAIVGDIYIKPYYGPYKIYIIPEAHLMNENAQNALLKTIEEPPEYGIIFLLTENEDMLLSTVRSRCITLGTEVLPKELIREALLRRCGLTEDEAERLSGFARGNLGAALELAEGGRPADRRERVVEWLSGIGGMNAFDIFQAAAGIGKEEPYDILNLIRIWFRDVLVRKSCPDRETPISYAEQEEAIEKYAQRMSYEELNEVVEALDKAQDRVAANVKIEAVFESLLLKIRRAFK